MNFSQNTTALQHVNQYAVKVNGGSGVLVSSLHPDVAYILTARHVAEKKQVVESYDGLKIKVKKCLTFPDRGKTKGLDCAILVIEPIEGLNYAPVTTSAIRTGTPCWMIGYPESRAQMVGNAKQIKNQDCTIGSAESHQFIINATNGPQKIYINGFSGAGVFIESNGRLELLGIEYGVDEAPIDYNEQAGRLVCYTMNHFIQLLADKKLPQLAPDYLACFSRISNLTFNLNFINNTTLTEVQVYLNRISQNLIDNGLPKPFQMVEKYGPNLLIPSTAPGAIMDRNLWIGLLEFYVICSAIDSVQCLTSEYIENSAKIRKFLYHNSSQSWLAKLREILDFANQTMSSHGVIIVGSPEGNPLIEPDEIHLNDIIIDIASPNPVAQKQEIDAHTVSKLESLSVHHLTALNSNCLVKNEYRLRGKSQIEFIKLFKEYYGEFIKG